MKMQRSYGFTLLELLIAVVVAAILASVALPSMLSVDAQRQAASVGQDFEQDVSWARSEAIAGQPNVSVTLMPNCSWTTQEGATPASVATHSKTYAQVQAQSPGLTCSGIPAAGLDLAFDSMGLVSSSASPVIAFGTGPDAVTMQIFSSGVIVGDPAHAS